jgi:hypothetical protein
VSDSRYSREKSKELLPAIIGDQIQMAKSRLYQLAVHLLVQANDEDNRIRRVKRMDEGGEEGNGEKRTRLIAYRMSALSERESGG